MRDDLGKASGSLPAPSEGPDTVDTPYIGYGSETVSDRRPRHQQKLALGFTLPGWYCPWGYLTFDVFAGANRSPGRRPHFGRGETRPQTGHFGSLLRTRSRSYGVNLPSHTRPT